MDPHSGRLYALPHPDFIRERGLVRAPKPNRAQVRRMAVKRGEPCPCGSGKKSKHCCRNLPQRERKA